MTSIKDKIVFVFNKYFFEFVDDLLQAAPHFTETLNQYVKVKNNQTLKHIESFVTEFGKVKKEIFESSVDDILEDSANNKVLKMKLIGEISVSDIVSKVEDKKNVLYYLYIFSLYASLFQVNDTEDQEALFEVYTKAIMAIQNRDEFDISVVLDQKIKSLLQNIIHLKQSESTTADEFVDDASEMLSKTKIGAIAQEIAQEIDMSKIKIDKPEDMLNLQNIFSANSPINEIIGKVGNKIQEKVTSGELRHEDLMSEALGMLKMFNKDSSADTNPLFNNPLMKDLMKNLGKGGKPTINMNNLRAESKRAQLRKKLTERSETM